MNRMEVVKILNASYIYWTPVAWVFFFLQVTLKNNNLGAHVLAHNHSALMLYLIFKTMLQHTEYLYTYTKSLNVALSTVIHYIFPHKSMSYNFYWNQFLLNFGSWACSWLQHKF